MTFLLIYSGNGVYGVYVFWKLVNSYIQAIHAIHVIHAISEKKCCTCTEANLLSTHGVCGVHGFVKRDECYKTLATLRDISFFSRPSARRTIQNVMGRQEKEEANGLETIFLVSTANVLHDMVQLNVSAYLNTFPNSKRTLNLPRNLSEKDWEIALCFTWSDVLLNERKPRCCKELSLSKGGFWRVLQFESRSVSLFSFF